METEVTDAAMQRTGPGCWPAFGFNGGLAEAWIRWHTLKAERQVRPSRHRVSVRGQDAFGQGAVCCFGRRLGFKGTGIHRPTRTEAPRPGGV